MKDNSLIYKLISYKLKLFPGEDVKLWRLELNSIEEFPEKKENVQHLWGKQDIFRIYTNFGYKLEKAFYDIGWFI